METHINTYRLNQGNKEYILNISMVGESIRIACQNSSNENNFSKDFTLEELKQLDPIFGIIQTPYEGLDYIDKALKVQKVGITEQGNNMKINFYMSRNYHLDIPSKNNLTGINTITKTEATSTFDMNPNLNLGKNSAIEQVGSFNESTPTIGATQGENYLSQLNTLNNVQTEEYNQFNTFDTAGAGDNFGSVNEYPITSGSVNLQETKYITDNITSQYTSEISGGLAQFKSPSNEMSSQYATAGSFDATAELGNLKTTNLETQQYTKDFNSQYITGAQDLTSQITTTNGMTQFSTGAEDITGQFSTGTEDITGVENINPQFSTGAENITPQFSTGAENITPQFSTGAENISTQFSTGAENIIGQFSTGTENITGQFSTGAENINPQFSTGAENITPQFSTGVENIAGQFSTGAENITPQFSTGAENITGHFSTGAENISTQFSTGAENITGHFSTGAENITTQFSTGAENITGQFSTGVQDAIPQFTDTTTNYKVKVSSTAQYSPPYITPADDINQTNQMNEYIKTTTTTTNVEAQPTNSTFVISLQKDSDSLRQKLRRTQYDLQTQTVPFTQPEPVNPISDEKINKIDGAVTSLKSEHQLIQDKLNSLAGQINSYKDQLSIMARSKTENEVNSLRAENMAIKKQLSELSNLRNDAAEVKFLRSQLQELEALRKKVAEFDILKGQLGELNELRAKAAELDSVKSRFNELQNLRAQVSKMGQIKQQLGELDALKAKIAELNGVKSQLEELNNLKAQVGQINILKQQIDELTNMKINEEDLENLKGQINELEKIKLEYELEIKRLREEQRRSSLEEQTSMVEMRKKTETEIKNKGMESRQLLFEDRPEQICVKGEIIHDTDELELLTRKINKLNQKLTLNLVYKATADSDKAVAFHEKCDDAKSTLVLVETDKGKRFGGYTTCSWSGDCVDKKDENAFVFSLDKMEIYENIPGEDAIGCYPKFGPIFLGCQIRIYDNAFTKGGTTFEKGLNYNTQEDFELTGGERVFQIKEIEVYEVIPQ